MLCFNESLQYSDRWSTRTVTVTGAGVTTAALPATNIFTRNPAQCFERTGITGGTSLTLDVRLAGAAGAVPLENFGFVFGLLNVQCINESTLAPENVTIRLAESNTAFTGPYLNDRTQQVRALNFWGPTPRQMWFASYTLASSAPNAGGGLPPGYLRLVFSGPSSNWTLRVGRLVWMSGLLCDFSPSLSRSVEDQTEIIRSFSGYPYALKRSRLRQYAASAININDLQAIGGSLGADSWAASVQLIGLMTGRSEEVCAIERINAPISSNTWQFQPVFGLLDDPLAVSRSTSTGAGSGISSSEFRITEIPQG